VKFQLSIINFLRERWKLLVVLNLLFFSTVTVTLFIVGLTMQPSLANSDWKPSGSQLLPFGGWLGILLGIFIFNLIISSLVFISLPGFLFFPLSGALLLYRAILWGFLLYTFPLRIFLMALPTVVLEGEAYVLAASAGTLVGMSWVKPVWTNRDRAPSPRLQALRTMLKEFMGIYLALVILLFAAAIAETVAILLIV
jgi:hypothetical protein